MSGLLFARFALAQDFGTEIVNNSLNGSLGTMTDPRELAGRIINIALGFLSVVAVGFILYAGFLWMTSNGEEDRITKAKQILRSGLIGLGIILSSWAIASFVILKLSGAIGSDGNSNGGGCLENTVSPCGCGGSMICSNGFYGACVGSNLDNCSNPPTSCDSSSTPGCQAASQICAAGDYCDNSCLCQTKAELGDSCDADLNNQTCDVDNNRCAEYLTCNPNTCLCDGPPAITGMSPIGGFCSNDASKSCAKDADCGEGNTCNDNTPNGAANNFITISGTNFGEYSATNSKIVFLGGDQSNSISGPGESEDPIGPPIGVPATAREAVSPSVINPSCISFWRNDQIVIAVPSGVQTGPIKVTNKEGLSDITNDNFGPSLPDFVANGISRPGLCDLDPVKGSLSSEVNYQGVNLYSGKAYFGNYKSNVSGLYSNFNVASGLSGTSTTPNIREGESGSFVETVVNGSLQKSNYLKFIKDREEGDGPYIMSFSPIDGAPGQYVTIKGSGFGGAKGENKVYFVTGNSKIEASYAFPAICANSVWGENQIIIKVPALIANDSYQLEVQIASTTLSTQRLNPNTFGVNDSLKLRPSLCKMDPVTGPIDTPLILWGEYFGKVGSNGLVQFNFRQNANGIIKNENEANVINTSVPKMALTGPVKVINNESGNELNFSVSECTKNEECNNQVCCPQNTYRKGRCVNDLSECVVDIPTSVYEWSFSTSFDASTTPKFSSCLGLSKYLGSCYQGAMCPNSAGACSSPSTSYDKVVGSCDVTCNNVPGCSSATCGYDKDLDKCVNKSTEKVCDLSSSISFEASDYSIKDAKPNTTEKKCNSEGKWEIKAQTSCPIGWTKGLNNACTQDDSSCNLCADKLTCEKVGTTNKCVSEKLCKDSQAICLDNLDNLASPDNCIIKVAPSCECCCRIGKDTEDCCAPLTCAGKCGSDVTANSNTYGSCSGCAAVGTTQDAHDSACNCANSSGKYCSISSSTPQGICTDCAGIDTQESCGDHSSVCCFDANKTATTTDDVCRGLGSNKVLSVNKNDKANYGYCAFFNCQVAPADPLICASTTPVKVGSYTIEGDCVSSCLKGSDDICAGLKTKDACSNESACCFDSVTKKCKSGGKITAGVDNGYCAYYNCNDGDHLSCSLVASTTGKFIDPVKCDDSCANPPTGAGLGCMTSTASTTCNFNLCTASGLSCLQDTGNSPISIGGEYPSCGTCCCQPKTDTTADSCKSPLTPNLFCQADTGSCSGASRGLCCGCTSDSDCGGEVTIGCGLDSCCQARPKVSSTQPSIDATNICRNAAIKITFNQKMDTNSFLNNFILFEEKTYGNGICPAGTFLADANAVSEIARAQNKNIFVRLWENIKTKTAAIFNHKNSQALGAAPSADKLYCSVPGTVSSEDSGPQTSLEFTPEKALSPATNYYVVVKGDETLTSKAGVLSASQIGMNEAGFREATVITNGVNKNYTTKFTNAVHFNNLSYKNAYSYKFTTLSDQGVSAGICAIEYVTLGPSSYLFKTTTNALNEKDDNSDATFDTAIDGDKAFTAAAYSSNNQLLYPVVGYAWDWKWIVIDPSVVDISTKPLNLPETRKLITAKTGVTDGQTIIRATIDMSKYRSGCGSSCNAFAVGDGQTASSDIYVFLCSNPWPAVKVDGTWSPWNDAGANCSMGVANSCDNFNYKFYYCRDAGGPGTLDDLPAINNSPITRSGNLLCSLDNTPCSIINSPCGAENKGVCLWNILKESYFFREAILSGATISSAYSTGKGGEVRIVWQSPAANVASYKVYYLQSGNGTMLSKEFKALGTGGVCSSGSNINTCNTIISGLNNTQDYIFKVSVISVNKTESSFSNELTAKPTDVYPPAIPAGLKFEVIGTQIKFSWTPDADKTVVYRLYHGVASGKYAESFDSAPGLSTMTLDLNILKSGKNYFALSAIDNAKNESAKSIEKIADMVNGLIVNPAN